MTRYFTTTMTTPTAYADNAPSRRRPGWLRRPRSSRQRLQAQHPVPAGSWAWLAVACLTWAAFTPAAFAQDPATNRPRCEQPVERWLDCANGVRIGAYEPAPDLSSFCEALADPSRRLKPVTAGSALFELPDGYRTMNTGLSGWLIFPREKGPTDVPASLSRWWRELGCVRS